MREPLQKQVLIKPITAEEAARPDYPGPGKTALRRCLGRLGQKTGFSLLELLGEIEKRVDSAGEKTVIEAADQLELVLKHPYVVYQSLRNASRFSRSERAGFLEMLVRIDLALKSTGQAPAS